MARKTPVDLRGRRRGPARGGEAGRGRGGSTPRASPSSPVGSPPPKRQRTEQEASEVVAPGSSKRVPEVVPEVEKERVVGAQMQGEQESGEKVPEREEADPGKRPYKAAFRSYGGHTITEADSGRRNADVAFGLLRAIGLPRDMEEVAVDGEGALEQLGQHIVQVTSYTFARL